MATRKKTTKKSADKKSEASKKKRVSSTVACSDVTVKDLKASPKYKLVEGRSTMNKAELCKAIKKVSEKKPTKKVSEKKPTKKVSEKKPTKKVSEKKVKKTSEKRPKRVVDKAANKKATKKVLKEIDRRLKPISLISPLKTPINTDLTADDIKDLMPLTFAKKVNNSAKSPLRKSPVRILMGADKVGNANRSPIKKSPVVMTPSKKYLKPIDSPTKRSIREHSQRNFKGVGKVNKSNKASPFKKSPVRINEEDNYISVIVSYGNEDKVIYAFPGDFWGQIIAQLPENWGKGSIVDTTLSDEHTVDEMDFLPHHNITARFVPQSTGWFW